MKNNGALEPGQPTNIDGEPLCCVAGGCGVNCECSDHLRRTTERPTLLKYRVESNGTFIGECLEHMRRFGECLDTKTMQSKRDCAYCPVMARHSTPVGEVKSGVELSMLHQPERWVGGYRLEPLSGGLTAIQAPSLDQKKAEAIWELAQAKRQAPPPPQPSTALPTDSAARKDVPLARGCLDYFPAALAEVARLSKAGNDKHNPGEELHHSRGKSSDHADCIIRHLAERGIVDTDGFLHDVKVAWRALANLQEALEARGAPLARGARLP